MQITVEGKFSVWTGPAMEAAKFGIRMYFAYKFGFP
jgi:hypothetical protein